MSHNTWVHRIVRPVVRPLAQTPVTPNQITWLRLLSGIAAAIAFSLGDDSWRHWGGFIFLASFLLDRADGELARLSEKKSVFGHKLDLISDTMCNALAFVGLGLGLRDGYFGLWAPIMGMLAGIAVGAVFFLVVRLEALQGARAAELGSAAGFDPDDGMLLVPLLIWVGQADLLLVLAASGAPLFCAGLVLKFRRSLFGRPRQNTGHGEKDRRLNRSSDSTSNSTSNSTGASAK